MSPKPPTSTLTPEQARNASRKIDEAFEEVARIAGSDLPPSDFFQDFLNKVIAGIDVPAGAVWLRTPQGFLQLQCQANIDFVGLDRQKGGRQVHNELLRQAFQMGRPMMLEPYGQSAVVEGVPAGNPTDFFCLLAPIHLEKECAGLVEVWSETRHDPRMQKTFSNYLVQMAGYAAQYLRNQSGRKLVGQEQIWAQVEAFSRDIHGSLDPVRCAYQIANEGRRLIQCDRLSVAAVHDRKPKILAVSGTDVVEKRSNLVQLMRQLTEHVLKWGERLTFTGSKDESLPPDVLDSLDEYLAESNSKFLIVEPLRDERQKDLPGIPRSALIMESFEPPESTEPLIARMEVVARHATPALYNSVEMDRVPLKWLWKPVAHFQNGLGGKTKAIIYSVIAAVALLIGVLIMVPYPLKLDANGQLLPRERQKIYAPHEGLIRQFLVEPNANFGPNTHLAVLFDHTLQAQLEQLGDEVRAAEDQARLMQQQLAQNKDPSQLPKLIGERDKQINLAKAKARQRDSLLRINNADPSRPGYFFLQAPKFDQGAAADHEQLWTVLDADFRENFLNRFVRPADSILRLGDKNGQWELELKIPQKHIDQVRRAFGTEPDPYLWVDILVTSAPTQTFKGILRKSKISGEAVPNKDDHNETSPVVTAYVSLDDPLIVETFGKDYQLPKELLVAGVEVHGKIRGNNHAMGYSLFYGLWEFIYEKIVFFF